MWFRRCLREEDERGQTVIEFALICTVLLMMSVGLIDVGRAFFQYNAVSSAAVYGARWGSVVGGSCAEMWAGVTNTSFCNQLGTYTNSPTTFFWQQLGNEPLQGTNTSCPSYTSTPSDYYQVSQYVNSKGTTIVGAIAQRFDSSSTSTSFIIGGLTPGFDLSKLYVCVQVTSGATGAYGTPWPGDTVGVRVYSPFTPVSALLSSQKIGLSAAAEFQVE